MSYLTEQSKSTHIQQEHILPHAFMDGKEGNTKSLSSPFLVEQCLLQSISTSSIPKVETLVYTEGPEELHGVTGFCLMPGSHITLHTYPHETKQFIFCDSFGTDVFHGTLYSEVKKSFQTAPDSLLALQDRIEGTLIHSSFPTRATSTYGPHLTATLAVHPSYVMDQGYIEYSLLNIVEAIGMTKIMGPFVSENHEYLSGIVVIAESHIAFHYNKLSNSLFVDIFSCKEFSTRKALRNLTSLFPGDLLFKKCVKRGEDFYRTRSHSE